MIHSNDSFSRLGTKRSALAAAPAERGLKGTQTRGPASCSEFVLTDQPASHVSLLHARNYIGVILSGLSGRRLAKPPRHSREAGSGPATGRPCESRSASSCAFGRKTSRRGWRH